MKSLYARGRGWLVALLVVGAAFGAVQRVSAGPGYAAVILADMPLGYWRLGESDPTMPAADASPNGNNGNYQGMITLGMPGAIAGDPDTAAGFDGSSGYVDVPSGTGGPFDLLNGFTLEAWVINNGTADAAMRIFSTRAFHGGTAGYGFGIYKAGNFLFTTYGIKDYASSAFLPQDGSWHYVAVTFDGTNSATYYLDGQSVDFVPGSSPARSSSFDFNIGANPDSDGSGSFQFWNGCIDEAAVYNYELTADQIAAHYQAAQ